MLRGGAAVTLLIVRHGETALNVARVLQPADTPLSERGLRQAAAIARRLAGMGLAAVVSSDLPRALQTAQAIAAACGLPLTTTPLLQERNFGALRGRSYDSLGFDPLTRDEAPPDGESSAQFGARCAAAWAQLLLWQAEAGGPLAVVSHGLVIRCWLQAGPLTLPATLPAPAALANCGLTVAAARLPHQVSLLDDVAHLTDGVGLDRQALSGG